MKTVTILGCGWLGSVVAKKLSNRFHLKVTTTTLKKDEAFKRLGYNSFILDENCLESLSDLLDCDYLLMAFPPSKFQNYLGFLNSIYTHEKFNTIKHSIFISSTSIYDKKEGVYTESSDIKTPSSKLVYEAENYVKNQTSTIFRCAGLMGENRIAGSYFAAKEVTNTLSGVNYVHQSDVFEAIVFCYEKKLKGVFNLCAPLHPSKKEVYSKNALKYGFESPVFMDDKNYERIIEASKIEEYGFEYTYPNPLEF